MAILAAVMNTEIIALNVMPIGSSGTALCLYVNNKMNIVMRHKRLVTRLVNSNNHSRKGRLDIAKKSFTELNL